MPLPLPLASYQGLASKPALSAVKGSRKSPAHFSRNQVRGEAAMKPSRREDTKIAQGETLGTPTKFPENQVRGEAAMKPSRREDTKIAQGETLGTRPNFPDNQARGEAAPKSPPSPLIRLPERGAPLQRLKRSATNVAATPIIDPARSQRSFPIRSLLAAARAF